MLTSCYGSKIVNDLLRLPVRPRRYVCFKLNGHTLQVLSGLNVRSVTLTQNAVSLSYSKETAEIEPESGQCDNRINRPDSQTFDLSQTTRIKSNYRMVKSQFKRNDIRIRTRVFSKYGEKQRNRVQPLLHNVSKRMIDEAKTKRYGIVMEKLTRIRRLYRRGNGQSRN